MQERHKLGPAMVQDGGCAQYDKIKYGCCGFGGSADVASLFLINVGLKDLYSLFVQDGGQA
jgi:hypothetical protein